MSGYDWLPWLGLTLITVGLVNMAFLPAQRGKKTALEERGLGAIAKLIPVTFWPFVLVRTLPLVVLGVVAIVVGVLTRR